MKKTLLTRIGLLADSASRSGSLKTIDTIKFPLDDKTLIIQANRSTNVKSSILETKIQQQELQTENKMDSSPTSSPSPSSKSSSNSSSSTTIPCPKPPKPLIEIDPFGGPNSELMLEESQYYRVLHNKFNVFTNHLLIVTKEFESQMEHLSKRDFQEIGNLVFQDDLLDSNVENINLQQSFKDVQHNSQNSQQQQQNPQYSQNLHYISNEGIQFVQKKSSWYSGDWLIFYNRGVFSGASQPHKHIQVLYIYDDDGTPRFPIIKDLDEGHTDLLNYKMGFVKLRGDESLEELHSVYKTILTDLNLEADKLFDDIILHEKYVGESLKLEEELKLHDIERDVNHLQLLVGDKLLTIDTNAERIPSYNLLFTSKWMLVVPRRHENCEGISGNSLVFLRSFFIGNESIKEKFLNIGVDNMLSHLTFPKEQN